MGPCKTIFVGFAKHLQEWRCSANTIIILPLKTEKVEAVKKELKQIHPEVLLFLREIKRLNVQEEHDDASFLNSLSAISISTESVLVPPKGQVSDSRIVHISVQSIDSDKPGTKCKYYIHKQAFPVKPENIVDQRKDVKDCEICLAFPLGERLRKGSSAAGIFAFLPTSMVTNFPFIIHSDFLLASSRESIRFDNKWNIGILELVPSFFVGAIVNCLKSVESIDSLSVSQVLGFLPAKESPFKGLKKIRSSIKHLVQAAQLVPCESFLDDKMTFSRPTDARRVSREFRGILTRLKKQGVPLSGLCFQEKHVLHNSVDNENYDELWNYLELPSASSNYDWYAKCIRAWNFVNEASADIYIQLLFFLADYWAYFPLESVNRIPLLKYVGQSGGSLSCSRFQIKQESLKI